MVLIVDIRRPMPQPFDAVNRLVQRIMKAVYGRHILERLAAMTPPKSQAAAELSEREPAVAGTMVPPGTERCPEPAIPAHDRGFN